MTPGQCRLGRALLGLSQRDVAARAEVGLSTVSEFEISDAHCKPGSKPKQPRRATLAAMRRVFEAAGITFIDDGKVHGATAPKPAPATAPDAPTEQMADTKMAESEKKRPAKTKQSAGRSKKAT
jgi:transcriptional regulator with XRE-family HTH domain